MKTMNEIRQEYKVNKKIKCATLDVIEVLLANQDIHWKLAYMINKDHNLSGVHKIKPYQRSKFGIIGLNLEYVARVIIFVTKSDKGVYDMQRMLIAMAHSGEIQIKSIQYVRYGVYNKYIPYSFKKTE